MRVLRFLRQSPAGCGVKKRKRLQNLGWPPWRSRSGCSPHPTAGLPGDEKAAKFPVMTASVTDLRRKTTELLEEVRRGEAVEIQHHGKTIARLVPEARPLRQVGRHAGAVLRSLREEGPSIPPPVEPEEDIIIADRRRRLSD